MADLEFRCAECNSLLDADIWNGYISVELCSHCEDATKDEAFSEGRHAGYDEGYLEGYEVGSND